jgi:hypothetical protein
MRLPAIDDRLAPPETRLEYLGGDELFALPRPTRRTPWRTESWPYVLRAHVAPGYRFAVDLLTRTATRRATSPPTQACTPKGPTR